MVPKQYPLSQLSFAVGAGGSSDAIGVVGNLGGNWLDWNSLSLAHVRLPLLIFWSQVGSFACLIHKNAR